MSIPRRVGVPSSKPAPQAAAPAPEPASVPETSQAEVTDGTVLKGRAALPAHMRELWDTAEGYAQELADEIAKWPEDQRRHGRLIIKSVIAKELLDDAGKAALGAAAVRRMAGAGQRTPGRRRREVWGVDERHLAGSAAGKEACGPGAKAGKEGRSNGNLRSLMQP